MSLCPSSETVNELWPGPYWLVAALLANTGLGLLFQEAASSRFALAEALSIPRQ
jgi:hypothetical protein